MNGSDMNRYLKYILLSLSTVSLSSCVDVNEGILQHIEKVKAEYIVCTESDGNTKTILDGQLGDPLRQLLWEPGDVVGIVNNSAVDAFANINDLNSTKGIFEGGVTNPSCENVYAVYPYSDKITVSKASNGGYTDLKLFLPGIQQYKKGTFASDLMPMAGAPDEEGMLRMNNLAGVLALNITGAETITSITFSGKDDSGKNIQVSGMFSVDLAYETIPEMLPAADANSSSSNKVVLDCGEGVALNETEPETFYIVLPAATYRSFSLYITSADGKVMIKDSERPLTIRRSNVTKTGALPYVGEVSINLSHSSTANCYIVTAPGPYSIDATVAGNGEFGIIDGMPMFAESTSINPVSAELLWEDHDDLIMGVAYADGKIGFTTTGIAGNALVAAKDADGKILWSWHIWCTDEPTDHMYKSSYGEFTVMDRNLGATRANHGTGDEWHESCGLSYQWGRKDPFAGGLFTSNSQTADIQLSIENPAQELTQWNTGYWSPTSKSIYDPCPAGYMVCSMDAWRGFSIDQVNGNYANGWNFKYDGYNSAWYPCKGNASESGMAYWGDSYMWSSSTNSKLFYFSSSSISVNRVGSAQGLNPLRCMKDMNNVKVIVRLASISEITDNGASVKTNVIAESVTDVSRSGIVVSEKSNVSIENGKVYESDTKTGELSFTITELKPLTKYYVKAFVEETNGALTYSPVATFMTLADPAGVDLSDNGTSNSYIVAPYETEVIYSIRMVKGNSEESVGDAKSACVLWETRNSDVAVTAGDLVHSVKIEDGKLKFTVAANTAGGNALIAVKDASGTVLWSWHIWITDYEPDSTAQLYDTGVMMMDRHLGALTLNIYQADSYGLLYQWGRKDPFVNAATTAKEGFAVTAPADAITHVTAASDNDSMEYSISHPTTALHDCEWNTTAGLWAVDKTIYDPCPVGWVVALPSTWTDTLGGIQYSYNGVYYGTYYQLASPNALYPYPGNMRDSSGFTDYNSHYCTWALEKNGMEGEKTCAVMAFYLNHFFNTDRDKDNLYSVRCMKYEDKVSGGDDEYEKRDEYEW